MAKDRVGICVQFYSKYGEFPDWDKRRYTYLADATYENVKHFTYAVVDSPSQGLVVVKIDRFIPYDPPAHGNYKHVVALFTLDYYNGKQTLFNTQT